MLGIIRYHDMKNMDPALKELFLWWRRQTCNPTSLHNVIGASCLRKDDGSIEEERLTSWGGGVRES